MNYFSLRLKQIFRRLDRSLDRRLLRILVRLFNHKTDVNSTHLLGGNAVRFSILAGLMVGTLCAALVSSCKSSQRHVVKNHSETVAAPQALTDSGSLAAASLASTVPTAVAPSASVGVDGEPKATLEGGPIVGVEAWQNGKKVDSIVTGQEVLFKLTTWTRDTDETSGCETNRGIVQVSWGVGSRPPEDVQRMAGQECRSFDYPGTFVKPGRITVAVDVVSVDGEQAHASASFAVTGNVITPIAVVPPSAPTAE